MNLTASEGHLFPQPFGDAVKPEIPRIPEAPVALSGSAKSAIFKIGWG